MGPAPRWVDRGLYPPKKAKNEGGREGAGQPGWSFLLQLLFAEPLPWASLARGLRPWEGD